MSGKPTKSNLDNKSSQRNPNNKEYTHSREAGNHQKNMDNHGNQLNPNNREYTHSREAGSKGQ